MTKSSQKRRPAPRHLASRAFNRAEVKVSADNTTSWLHGPRFSGWSSLHSYILLALATLLCLIPFSGRAFHVDDTLFVRAARQIAQHPSDPYGFEIIWDAENLPMSQVTQNPPLAAYYIALLGQMFGWSERALHLGFIPVTIALVCGTYRLAQKFTREPLLAAMCTLLTPGVLVSANSVMCDTMMVALWIWAAYFWIEGLDRGRAWLFFLSSVLLAASALTKYFGASLVLLLLVYSIVRVRGLRPFLVFLLIPVAALIAYEFWTAHLYGRGLLQSAAEFSQSQSSKRGSLPGMTVIGLSYVGGCSLLGLSFASVIWSRRQAFAGLLAGAIAGLAVTANWLNIGWYSTQSVGAPQLTLSWYGGIQLALCTAAGIFVLALGIKDFREAKDADSSFLTLWVLGTFFFAAFVNWTVNARSVLPLIPAAAILLARRFDEARTLATRMIAMQIAAILFLSAVFSLWITCADSALANSGRTAASLVYENAHDKGGNVWFVGHWGFQYYMESFGFAALDLTAPQAHSGDFVVIAGNNSLFANVVPAYIASRENLQLPLKYWATTISSELGAGFYASYWGPLPYAIGPVPAERYSIIRVGNIPVPKS